MLCCFFIILLSDGYSSLSFDVPHRLVSWCAWPTMNTIDKPGHNAQRAPITQSGETTSALFCLVVRVDCFTIDHIYTKNRQPGGFFWYCSAISTANKYINYSCVRFYFIMFLEKETILVLMIFKLCLWIHEKPFNSQIFITLDTSLTCATITKLSWRH